MNKNDLPGMLIGGGLLIGLGVGFLVYNIVAGLLIGLGCGLVAAVIAIARAPVIKMSKEERLKLEAEKRAEEKIGFYWHIGAFIIISPFLVLVWYFTGRYSALGVPWFLFAIVGWGIGVLAHYLTLVVSER